MNMKIYTTIFGDDEMKIDITAEYSPPTRGARDQYGAALEPDDPEEIEILDAVDELGNTRTLSSAEHQAAIEAAGDAL